MTKNINEKTFELNITNELLNLSKSFICFMYHLYGIPWFKITKREHFRQLFNQATIFAAGLTQKEESDPQTGGYDVSIHYNHPNGQEGRLMFLQYKAGNRKSYSNRSGSKFCRQTARNQSRSSEHALFTFNDAANCTQHSTLRNLANKKGVSPNSVIYVFPRITEKSDFKSKVGNLIPHSSFVPVLDIDHQASNQTPPIIIYDGITHKYRTSYDGSLSEVNSIFFHYLYDNTIITELFSELICIQIERFAKIFDNEDRILLKNFLDTLSDSIYPYVEVELKHYPSNKIVIDNVTSYIKIMSERIKDDREIPEAPSKYTTVVPKDGMNLMFENKNDISVINYQIF